MYVIKNLRCFLLLAGIVTGSLMGAEYKIIVNNSVGEQVISQKNLQKIFLGKQTKWENGQRILPVLLKEGALKEVFLDEIVKKSSTAFKNYWNNLVFTGKGIPPVMFAREAEVLDYVQKNPGAVGFVSDNFAVSGVIIIEIL